MKKVKFPINSYWTFQENGQSVSEAIDTFTYETRKEAEKVRKIALECNRPKGLVGPLIEIIIYK